MPESNRVLFVASYLTDKREKSKYCSNDVYNHRSDSPTAKRCPWSWGANVSLLISLPVPPYCSSFPVRSCSQGLRDCGPSWACQSYCCWATMNYEGPRALYLDKSQLIMQERSWAWSRQQKRERLNEEGDRIHEFSFHREKEPEGKTVTTEIFQTTLVVDFTWGTRYAGGQGNELLLSFEIKIISNQGLLVRLFRNTVYLMLTE